MELEDRDFVAEAKREKKIKAIAVFIIIAGLPLLIGIIRIILIPWGEMSTRQIIADISFAMLFLLLYAGGTLGIFWIYRMKFGK